jgi:hypothetical protein
MARTIATIEAALDASITGAITSPSASSYAEWKLWRSIFAKAIWAFECILDLFRAEIENTISTKQPGSFDWYYEKVLAFQGVTDDLGTCQGDNLVVKDGIVKYETIDVTRRIVTSASLRAGSGVLAVKVAKDSDTEGMYQALTESEQLALGLYLDNIKYPGTAINVISMDADLVKYSFQIVYDPIYTTETVQTNVKAALETYRASLGFGDTVYANKMIQAIMNATGVVSVKITSLQGYDSVSLAWKTIDIVYTLVSGYFNYDKASALTFISYKTLLNKIA